MSAEVCRGRCDLTKAVGRLERVLKKQAASGRSLCIAVGERTLTVDTELAEMARGGAANKSDLSSLTLRSLAWQVKSLGDLDQVASAVRNASCGDERALKRLVFNVAAGKLLEDELTRAIDRRGRHPDARWLEPLQGLRYRVRQRLLELNQVLRESSEGGVEEALAILRSSGAAPYDDVEVVRAPRGARSGPSRVVVALSVVLALALVGHVAVNGARWFQPEAKSVFSLEDFTALPGVIELEDCPPSVFLTVEVDSWARLDESGRLAMLDEARAIIGRHGYEGALVSTEEGAVVAQWATHSGNVLFDSE